MGLTLTRATQIRELRLACGLSQEKLARLAHIGLRTVQRLENEDGNARTNYATAQALLGALNSIRESRGVSLLQLDDIDWDIRG